MHHIFYAGTRMTTGDDLARALLAVVARASRRDRSEVVEIPCRSIDGIFAPESALVVTLVVVPHAPIAAVGLADSSDELIDEVAVARMGARQNDALSLPEDDIRPMFEPATFNEFDDWI